jgi:hypothetical protein
LSPTGRYEAASSTGQDAAPSRLRWEVDSPRRYQVMNTQTIDLDGFEIEIAPKLGLPTACNREMRVRVSHHPPISARELDGRVLV